MGRTDRATIRPIGSPHSGLMVPGRVGAVVSHKSWPLNPQGMRPTKILPKLDVDYHYDGPRPQWCTCTNRNSPMFLFIFMSRVGFELYYMAFFHMTATLYLTALAL